MSVVHYTHGMEVWAYLSCKIELCTYSSIRCSLVLNPFVGPGKNWIKVMAMTASLFPFMCFGIGLVLNTIAIFYGSLAAIPFGTMVVVFILWAFISFPLALLGTVVGRNWSGAPNNPCRVKTIPRPIPEKKWYLTPSVIALMGGLLPFGSIFIEMYFVFTSFWNYKVWKTGLFLPPSLSFITKEALELTLMPLLFSSTTDRSTMFTGSCCWSF